MLLFPVVSACGRGLLRVLASSKFYILLAAVLIVSPVPSQACSGPDGAPGDIMFNSTDDAFQGCTLRGWIAFHDMQVIDPCTTSNTAGTACADGQTVYAGSWNGSRYYTTKLDQAATPIAYYGTNNVNLGGGALSLTDGLQNTNTVIASIEANPQTGSCNAAPHNPPACSPNAHILCRDLRTTLGGNWYLPARDELINVLFANKSAIGGFTNASYWSSTEYDFNSIAYFVSLSSGAANASTESSPYRVRCVRK